MMGNAGLVTNTNCTMFALSEAPMLIAKCGVAQREIRLGQGSGV